MTAKFRAWVPNATGNLSFSLIGLEGQPSACQSANFVRENRRLIVCGQRRNLSDNLIFKGFGTRATGVHALDFSLIAKSDPHRVDRSGVLRGWIFVHDGCPLDMGFLNPAELDLFEVREALRADAMFGLAFRLYRSGRIELRVPESFQVQDVRWGKQIPLHQSEALRPLVAQCFYFLRDITHRHQHHSSHSDTLTQVWPASDRSLWIRETLYELYRRVLMLRRQRSPRGQEDALGILAYVASFESTIADPYRRSAASSGAGYVPVYEKAALKESLTSNLETKRRGRIQRNVLAAIIPAFTAAMLGLANAIYAPADDFVPPASAAQLLGLVVERPVTAAIHVLSTNEWAFPALLALGFAWIANFTGVTQPSERSSVKWFTQAVAVWGRARAVLSAGLMAAGLVVVIFWLFRI
jgi:hypothetical protein